MIGSQAKVQKVFRTLAEEGILPARLRSVHAPIGLDIGARTPEEIALSIWPRWWPNRRGAFRKAPIPGPPRAPSPWVWRRRHRKVRRDLPRSQAPRPPPSRK